MVDLSRYYERVHEVAFRLNAHLPTAYQAQIFEEGIRLGKAVLAPRSLDERLILLVGGAGYIGSVLTMHLLTRGYRVRCLDAMIYNNQSAILPYLGQPGYEFVGGDLVDPDCVTRALAGATDVVVLAGLVGDPITKKAPDAAQKINHDGMLAMLRSFQGRGLNRVVFISTCSNYGLIPVDSLADEEFPLSPLSLYAKAKVTIEQELLGTRGAVDYQPVVLRFATAFGLSPRMRFDLTVSEFTRALFHGEDLVVYDGHTWRPYCHVADFAEVIRRVLEAPEDRVAWEVFNAGGDVNNYTKQMIVDAVLTELPGATVRYQEHGSDPRNYRVDFAKIRRTLHFEPRFTVRDGIRELIEGLRQGLFARIDEPRSFFGNYEIDYP